MASSLTPSEICPSPCAAASEDIEPGPTQSDKESVEPPRKVARSNAPAEDWAALAHQCDVLDIGGRELQLEQDSLEDALAAIKASKMASKWQQKQRQKLRKTY